MIRILKLVLLLVVSQVAFAQAPSNYTNINGRYRWIAGMFDSTFHIPKGSTPSLRTGGSTNAGALFYKTSDSTVRYWTGSNWLTIADTGRFVPYTGAIDTLNMGQFGVKTKFIQFDTSTRTVNDRVLQWSNDNGTLSFGMTNGGTIEQEIGLQQFARVKNVQGSQINKGQVVYLYGASGDRASVKLADNRADSTSSKTLGIAIENIAINGEGFVGTFGTMSGLNLSAYTPGDQLYLDSIPGGLTKTKPQAPYHLVFIGVVERANAGNGLLFTNVQNGYELEELHNVKITTPVRNNALLVYDSLNRLWVDTTLNAIGGVTGSGIANYMTRWTGANSVDTSQFYQSGQNIGLGTITPGGRLAIVDTGSFALKINYNSASTDANNNAALYAENNGLSSYVAILNEKTTNNTGGQYPILIESSLSSGTAQSGMATGIHFGTPDDAGNKKVTQLALRTTDPAAATYTNRAELRLWNNGTLSTPYYLLGNGNMGLGTSTPDSNLTVVNGAYFQRGVRMSGLPTGVGTKALRINASGTLSVADTLANGISGTGTTNYIPKFTSSSAIGNSQIYDNGTSVGIGTIAPAAAAKLELIGDYRQKALAGNSNGFNISINSSTDVVSLTNFYNAAITFGTNNTEQMRLTSTGLGIGTSSPAYRLDVLESGATTAANSFSMARITGSDAVANDLTLIGPNTSQVRIKFGDPDDATIGEVGYNHSTNAMRFNTNGAQRMTIDASGNLGLGVTPSAWGSSYKAIQFGTTGAIFGESGDAANYFTTNTFVDGVGFKYITSDFASGYFQENGVHSWKYAASGTAGNAITFTTGMTLNASGNLGLGVTPSAWASTVKAMQIGLLGGYSSRTGGNGTYFSSNVYFSGDPSDAASNANYIATTQASAYMTGSGTHKWFIAPSGTAGNAISFTQAMTLDASGNLMVGGTSVYGATITSYASATRSGGIGIRNSAGTIAGGFYTYASGSGSGSTDIYAEATGFLAFATASTERMRITSAGNVGIGTTSPASVLNVLSTKTTALSTAADFLTLGATIDDNTAYNNVGIGGGIAFRAKRNSSGTQTVFGAIDVAKENAANDDYRGALRFWTNQNATGVPLERMRITSGGNVRIVNGGDFEIYPSSGSSYTSMYNDNDNFIIWNNGSERMRITSGGNVGIGTTSPSYPLHIVGFANSTSGFRVTDGVIDNRISWSSGNVGFFGTISNHPIAFNTNSTERMRITSGGNVGIGNTNPNDFSGDANTLVLGSTSATLAGMTIANSTTGTGSIYFADGTDNTNKEYRGFVQYDHSGDGLSLGAGGASRLYMTSTVADFTTSIKTGAPSGGTAQPYKWGSVVASSVTIDPDNYVDVEINGVSYKLALAIPSEPDPSPDGYVPYYGPVQSKRVPSAQEKIKDLEKEIAELKELIKTKIK